MCKNDENQMILLSCRVQKFMQIMWYVRKADETISRFHLWIVTKRTGNEICSRFHFRFHASALCILKG